jgi:hypothetical protein
MKQRVKSIKLIRDEAKRCGDEITVWLCDDLRDCRERVLELEERIKEAEHQRDSALGHCDNAEWAGLRWYDKYNALREVVERANFHMELLEKKGDRYVVIPVDCWHPVQMLLLAQSVQSGDDKSQTDDEKPFDDAGENND